jgi:UDP-N-acetylmuramyl tripeptide synthase
MLAVLTALIANDVSVEQAISQLKQLKSVDGRLEIINSSDTTSIDGSLILLIHQML